jgi:RNA polymerase sigma-70 factor (ECF subfamily)
VAADPVIGRAAGPPALSPPVHETVQSLYESYGARVLAYCRRRLHSREEAEDALQTTFLYAARGLQRGVVPETEVAWLLKIAHNVCLTHWDSDRRRRRLEVVREPERLDVAARAATEDSERVRALRSALADLTELQRNAVVLREWRGLSYAEIARELGLTVSAVETLLFRARRALVRNLVRQDVERPRTRLARCLDLGGLASALKAAFGSGTAKLAAGLAGTALLAGAIPDVPPRPAPSPPPAPTAVVPATALPPAVVDPVTAPAARAAAGERERRPAADEPRRQRSERRTESGRGGRSGGSASPAPGLGGVGTAVNGTVEGVTGTVEETLGTVTGTVEETVETAPEILPPVLDLVDGVVGGASGGEGGLLP